MNILSAFRHTYLWMVGPILILGSAAGCKASSSIEESQIRPAEQPLSPGQSEQVAQQGQLQGDHRSGGTEKEKAIEKPQSDRKLLTVATLDSLQLELSSRDGRCEFRSKNGKLRKTLDVAYPCGFVRATGKKSAQTHHYDAIGHVLVVAGPPAPSSSYTADSNVRPEHICSNEGQAIIVADGPKLVVRPGKNIPLGFCHNLGFDEKDYYGFAHPQASQ